MVLMKFVYCGRDRPALIVERGARRHPEGTWLSQDGGTKVKLTIAAANCAAPWSGSTSRSTRHRQAEDRQAQSRSGQARAAADRPAGGQRLAAERPGQWSGLIYNADDGHTYQAHFKVQSATTAKVQGCVLRCCARPHLDARELSARD